MKKIVLVLMIAVMSLTGCGGDEEANDVFPVVKTSIVDGRWTSGSATDPYNNTTTKGVYSNTLNIYKMVNLSNEVIKTSGYSTLINTTNYSNSGIFSVSGNTLTYTLTKSSTSTLVGDYVPGDFSGGGSNSPLNITNTVTVSVSENFMTWTDSNGVTVATFTK